MQKPLHQIHFAKFIVSGFAFVLGTSVALAQTTRDAPGDSTHQPMIRFTPNMARALAGMCSERIAERYDLDQAASQQASQIIARRLMVAAHSMGEPGYEFAEYVLAEVVRDSMNGSERRAPPPELLQRGSEQAIQFLPVLRELVAGVGNDLRSVLPLKQQFKLAADLAITGTALNAFDEYVHRWARGEAFTTAPFRPQELKPPGDPEGESNTLKNARKWGQQTLASAGDWWQSWGNYIEQAKKFYQFDASQCASADSLLREFAQRLSVMMQDEMWRENLIRTETWRHMSWPMMPGGGLLPIIAQRRTDECYLPFGRLDGEFKQRIEQIPTAAQRQSAEARLDQMLTAKALTLDTENVP